jgi:long-chain fatty acid transport protein
MAIFGYFWLRYIRVNIRSQGKVDTYMNNIKYGLILLVTVGFTQMICDESHSSGFAIAEQTATGVGMANAITAGVEDPSAVYVNPAALLEINGNQLMGGINYINTNSSIKNGGAKSRNIHDDDFLPNLFANYHIPGTDLGLGIGSYTPFGLATSYKENSFTRFAAIRTELRTIYVTPAIAWQPSPYLSLGAGVSFVHSSALLSRAIFLGAVGVGEGHLRITDTDNAYGYNLGILVKPHEQIKFGITYRSRVGLKYDDADVKFRDAAIFGGARATAKASGITVPIPPVINAGVQWQINPFWAVELDYNFTRWSEFEHLKATFSPSVGLAAISGFLLDESWKDTSSVRLGTKFNIDKNLQLRAGITWDDSPVPDRTLSPAIPSADILTLNGGVGYAFGNFNVDLGYMAVFYKTRTVTNNILETGGNAAALPFPIGGRDKYKIFQNFVSLHLRYRF